MCSHSQEHPCILLTEADSDYDNIDISIPGRSGVLSNSQFVSLDGDYNGFYVSVLTAARLLVIPRTGTLRPRRRLL